MQMSDSRRSALVPNESVSEVDQEAKQVEGRGLQGDRNTGELYQETVRCISEQVQ
jgi:hypothetical protein